MPSGDNCPQTTGRAARECVNRPLLLQYLMNTSFEGMSGTVAFDANGNRLGRYEISQVKTIVRIWMSSENHSRLHSVRVSYKHSDFCPRSVLS